MQIIHVVGENKKIRKEIEVKAKAPDLDKLKEKLIALGCVLGEPVVQHDTIFTNFEGDFTAFMPGTSFLRIRESGGKAVFNLKQPQSNELDVIEHETEIQDSHAMLNILSLLGFKEAVRVHKTRIRTKYNDLEICLDDVKDLGTFIEVEKITEEADAGKIQEELFMFLESLGVKRDDRVTNGYDTLIYLRNHQK